MKEKNGLPEIGRSRIVDKGRMRGNPEKDMKGGKMRDVPETGMKLTAEHERMNIHEEEIDMNMITVGPATGRTNLVAAIGVMPIGAREIERMSHAGGTEGTKIAGAHGAMMTGARIDDEVAATIENPRKEGDIDVKNRIT